MRVVELMPQVQAGLGAALLKQPGVYPITKSLMKEFVVAKGQIGHHLPNMFDGILPKQVVICMVPTDNFHGRYDKNP